METFTHWITQYGYFGIFGLLMLGIVGLPIPDESLLAFSGYLISKGKLQMLPTFASAFLGSVCGMSLSYVLGRFVGLALLHKYGRLFKITPEKMEKMHAWFERVGKFGLMIGYYLPGIRHLTAFMAGNSRLDLFSFSFFAFSGALIWTALYLSIGYFLGEKWKKVFDLVQENLMFVAAALLIGTLLVFWAQKKFFKKNGQSP
ncbi:MAG: DedA family protein [bacterium]